MDRWQRDLAGLADELDPVPPDPRVWARLREAVREEAAAGRAADARPRRWGWRALAGSLGFWRMLAGAGLASTAALAAVLIATTPDDGPTPPPPAARTLLVSSLLPADGPPAFVVTYDPARATILVVPAAVAAVRGRVPHLWLVSDSADAPVALGPLDPSRPLALALAPIQARLVALQAGLVVTLEPTGAVNADAPGPVIAHGRFVNL